MTAMTQPLDRYCGTCRYALEHIREHGTSRYEHTAAWRRDNPNDPHVPWPVPALELLALNMFCDICSIDQPVWMYTFVPLKIRSTRGVEQLGAEWALCGQCAAVAERRSVAGLLACAARGWTATGREVPDLDAILGSIYGDLLGCEFTRREMAGAR